jgi:hypothetical protein
MSKDDEISVSKGEMREAINFLMSLRGRYILSQAIHLAVSQLETVVPEHMQEVSNIEDMKYINEHFGLGAMLQDQDKDEE